MFAKLYCKTLLPVPNRVVLLGEAGDSSLGTNILTDGPRTRQLEYYQVRAVDDEKSHRQYGHKRPSKYIKVSEPLAEDLKKTKDELSDYDLMFPRVNNELFTWMPPAPSDIFLDPENETHNDTIKKASLSMRSSNKHFHEVRMIDDPAGYGSHYDWRFFREILPHHEHRAALHRIARAWQQFADEAGILYWYAHGSLLGHFWNGITLPWDADHDIQMPLAELDRLGHYFNRTLVVQNPVDGYHKFLIDVNPYYVQRSRGNGRNVIDARFIDVETGVYIDITGLSRNNPARKMVTCKNRHFYHVEAFQRLRRTNFEGYPALIPSFYAPMLRREYKYYTATMFKQWQYNKKIRLWEFKDSCQHYLSMHKFSPHVYCFPQDYIDDPNCTNDYGTCDRISIDQFKSFGDVTERYGNESAIFNELFSPGSTTFPDDDRSTNPLVGDLVSLLGSYRAPFFNVSESIKRL